jgi:HK97 gp10 family phage protein
VPDLDVKFAGLQQLDEALKGLSDKLQRNVLRAALRAGAKEIADEAKRLVPVKSGRLRDTIRVTSRIVRGVPTAKVVVGGKSKGTKKGAFYAPMIEFGTQPHTIRSRSGSPLRFNGVKVLQVRHPGAKKKPFMRPASDSRSGAAVQRFSDYVRARLTKEGISIPDVVPEDNE